VALGGIVSRGLATLLLELLGMSLVQRLSSDATAWMWGVNGACGTLASIAAVAVSISVGIRANLVVAALLYLSLIASAAALARSRTAA
jgi:hypothetical protein